MSSALEGRQALEKAAKVVQALQRRFGKLKARLLQEELRRVGPNVSLGR